MLSQISRENQQIEKATIDKIFRNIDDKKCTIFNAGAGAGKTYALILSLKYAVNTYGKMLKEHNRQIICITYTNVATEEIKKRLGNTSIVRISTIHERIWNFIHGYQKELVELHLENLIKQVDELVEQTTNQKEFELYRQLSNDDKSNFFNIMFENKDTYYKSYNLGAKDFKQALSSILGVYASLLKNVAHFKKIVNTLFRIGNYKKCIQNIHESKPGYNEVLYNVLSNRDQLHRMKISHDTLLEYGYQMIKKYDLLKRFLVDKYPFMFIDEYQDTKEIVISVMDMLQQFSVDIKHPIFVGYFGDSVQNIYEDGVGTNIGNFHSGLEVVNKEFNRRSAQEIVYVANKIRNDEIVQSSIFEDCQGGSVEFYVGDERDATDFIEKNTLNATKENPVHCFMLTNKSVAQFSGFENLYLLFSSTQYYKTYYQQLNTELLSDDPSKLGEIPLLIFRIVKFINKVRNEETSITDVLTYSIYANNNLSQVKVLVDLLKRIEGTTLLNNIQSICGFYQSEDNLSYKKVIDSLFDIDESSIVDIKRYMIQKLYPNMTEEIEDDARKNVENILNLEMNEYTRWYDYLTGNHLGNVVYHTYHRTKGLEFDNVIIVLGNSFGKERNYFNLFFKNYKDSGHLIDEDLKKYEQARNLLYVSVTRAVKNLKILYIDDVSGFSDVVESIFGEIQVYSRDN
ncbi:UvrD-helicase domain-containing protein [Sporolactobacillus laevolacticus]|uniref:UvrD-like helicase ATP-binding domain-containing protein n=1 Tax=Sporolactobacillus laevolacticus DSM 442 TaxID=1395513 RepID=V6IWJ3_9BACL|nr:ATP-dependent helicase [Sporolactobacillus laevolacticus]EST10946.1 hypothetical protein P343_15125 [Sporolactobacillus laevolacticus DSM 442]